MSLFQGWQYFFVVFLAFAVIGFMRGWRREIVSLAFTLAAVLIAALQGGNLIAQAIFVRLPLAFQDPNNLHAPSPPTSTEVLIVTVFTLVILIALGYIIGNKAFPKPTTPGERVLGAIPAIISGIAIYSVLSRLTNVVNRGQAFTLALPNPNPDMLGNYILLIFVVLVVLVIIGLVTSSAKKGGGAPKKR